MTADEVLSPSVVDAAIAEQRLEWSREDHLLVKEVRLATFRAALAYVQSVGELAEAAGHHPDIDIRWRSVTLRLTTHSAGGLTERDLALAAQIDGLGDRRGVGGNEAG